MQIVRSHSAIASVALALVAASARAATFYSDGAVLSLAERNGAVEFMRGADGVARVVAADEAFTLQLRDEEGNPLHIASSAFRFSSDGGELRYEHANGLKVRVSVRGAGGAFLFRPEVSGIPEGMLLEWFDGPHVQVKSNTRIFWPYMEGCEVSNHAIRLGTPPSGSRQLAVPTVEGLERFQASAGIDGFWGIRISAPGYGAFEDFRLGVRGVPGWIFLSSGRHWK